MGSTLPQPADRMADLEAEVATLRRQLGEILSYFRRLGVSPEPSQASRPSLTAAQIRARRQRIAASGLWVVRDGG